MKWTLLILLFSCGCALIPASSNHVHEGDKITANLASQVASKYPEDYALQITAKDANEHAKKDAGIPLPPSSSIPWEALGPFGVVAGGLFAAYQKRQTIKQSKLAKELRDLEPEAARKRYDEVS